MLSHGFPQIYWQFLANIERLRHVILPLPVASLGGLRALQHLALQDLLPLPSFIYLDAAHEKGETLVEIMNAFHLLSPGGILLGDDLDWPAVETDLQEFMLTQPSVMGLNDPILGNVPGLAFSESRGYWVLASDPPQWAIRKQAGGSEELRVFVESAEDGDNPTEYTPIRPEDHRASAPFEDGNRVQ